MSARSMSHMGQLEGMRRPIFLRPFLDLYGIATDKWTPMSDSACNPRDHTVGALINDRMCVAGGRNGAEIN
jgi:hypothetical protein